MSLHSGNKRPTFLTLIRGIPGKISVGHLGHLLIPGPIMWPGVYNK